MSRRKKVCPVDPEAVKATLTGKGWSNAFFCEKMMRKSRGWITEWKRGHNFPSPEEAARMCAILQVTPEEILTNLEDVNLVKALIDSQRPADEQKEKPAQEGELDEVTRKLFKIIDESSDAERNEMLDYIEFIKARRRKGSDTDA